MITYFNLLYLHLSRDILFSQVLLYCPFPFDEVLILSKQQGGDYFHLRKQEPWKHH